MNLRFKFLYVILSALMFSISACTDRKLKNNDTINLDQDVTNNLRPGDSIFNNFETNWKKFISPVHEFTLPVRIPDQSQPEQWQPLVYSNCIYSEEAGGRVAQVELQWQAAEVERSVRFDISLQYQGFEKGYYTTIMAKDTGDRFNIPENSNFIDNSEAVLLIGPPLFPKMLDYTSIQSQVPGAQQTPANIQQQDTTSGVVQQQRQITTEKDSAGYLAKNPDVIQPDRNVIMHKLTLRDLGLGLSYRIRICTLEGEVWRPTEEYVFSTPICPIDDYDDN